MKAGNLDLNLLVAFEALYQEQSVTAAGRRLGLGQPAMSGALARLRLLLGDPVLERVGGRMLPTPRAREMAPSLLACLEGVRQTLREQVPFRPEIADATFTIASTDYTSLVIAPGLIQRLRAEAPGVELRLIGYDKDEVADLLDRNAIDLALGVFTSPPERAVLTALYTESFVGMARRDHPAVDRGAMSLGTFVRQAHALVTVRRDARGVIDEALATRGLTRQVALTLPHMLALPDVLAATDLIAAVPARLAARLGAGLQTFAIPLSLTPWRVGCLWNPNLRKQAASAWLRAAVASAAAT